MALRYFKWWFVLSMLFCAACGPKAKPATNELSEHQGLYEVLSRYYCKKLTWPKNIDELIPFATKENMVVHLEQYLGSNLKVDRAILLTLTKSGTKQEPGFRVSFVAPPLCGEASAKPGEIWMAGGRIHLKVPKTFKQLNSDEVAERWGKGPYPDVAWRNQETEELLAVRFGEAPLKRGQYADMRDALVKAYSSSSKGIAWKEKDVQTVGKRSWISLAFESQSKKGELLNVSNTTEFDGKILTFSWIGPAHDKEVAKRSHAMLERIEIINK